MLNAKVSKSHDTAKRLMAKKKNKKYYSNANVLAVRRLAVCGRCVSNMPSFTLYLTVFCLVFNGLL